MPSPIIAGGVKMFAAASGYFAAIFLISSAIVKSCVSFVFRSSQCFSGTSSEATFSP